MGHVDVSPRDAFKIVVELEVEIRLLSPQLYLSLKTRSALQLMHFTPGCSTSTSTFTAKLEVESYYLKLSDD